jgi:hypothetical protein
MELQLIVMPCFIQTEPMPVGEGDAMRLVPATTVTSTISLVSRSSSGTVGGGDVDEKEVLLQAYGLKNIFIFLTTGGAHPTPIPFSLYSLDDFLQRRLQPAHYSEDEGFARYQVFASVRADVDTVPSKSSSSSGSSGLGSTATSITVSLQFAENMQSRAGRLQTIRICAVREFHESHHFIQRAFASRQPKGRRCSMRVCARVMKENKFMCHYCSMPC